jgi:hypothetical protein
MILQAEPGMNIWQAARLAVTTAAKNDSAVSLVFNGLTIRVGPFSFAGDIVTIYDLKHELRRLGAPATSPYDV